MHLLKNCAGCGPVIRRCGKSGFEAVCEIIRAAVHVVDSMALERSLYLTIQFLELGFPVVIALNMMDEAKRKGLF